MAKDSKDIKLPKQISTQLSIEQFKFISSAAKQGGYRYTSSFIRDAAIAHSENILCKEFDAGEYGLEKTINTNENIQFFIGEKGTSDNNKIELFNIKDFCILFSNENIAILNWLKENEHSSLADISYYFDIPVQTISRHFRYLDTYGVISYINHQGKKKKPIINCKGVEFNIYFRTQPIKPLTILITPENNKESLVINQKSELVLGSTAELRKIVGGKKSLHILQKLANSNPFTIAELTRSLDYTTSSNYVYGLIEKLKNMNLIEFKEDRKRVPRLIYDLLTIKLDFS